MDKLFCKTFLFSCLTEKQMVYFKKCWTHFVEVVLKASSNFKPMSNFVWKISTNLTFLVTAYESSLVVAFHDFNDKILEGWVSLNFSINLFDYMYDHYFRIVRNRVSFEHRTIRQVFSVMERSPPKRLADHQSRS